jgi:CBS domain-containing protein
MRNDFLREAAGKGPDDQVRISIRDLIAHWGARRRGYLVVDQIRRDLKKAGLTTVPPFTDGWIDNRVTLVPTARKANKGSEKPPASVHSVDLDDQPSPDVGLRVGSLPSANLGVKSLTPSDSLEKAQSMMLLHDYSQLAVMSGTRYLRGAISWEAIAQAKIRNPNAVLKEAVIDAEVVRASDDLLSKIPRIMEAGFVFVQASDNQVTGIVTTADLSEQFATLATPFLLLAEIERRLRRVVDRFFTSAELQAVVDSSDGDREVSSADDLTLGEYVRLLELEERWKRLGWALDRKVFISGLHEVRAIRNEVMHFSPDPLDTDQVNMLENFLKWIRRLDAE